MAAQDPLFADLPSAAESKRPKLKLRSACDFCHAAKVKCSGELVCARCQTQELPCSYSYAMRAGKPKGSRNRKTLEKQARLRQQHAASRTPRHDWHALPADLHPSWADAACMDFAVFNGPDQPIPGTSTLDPVTGRFTDADSLLLDAHLQTPPLESFQWTWPDCETAEESSSSSASTLDNPELSASCDCFDVQTANLSALHSLHRSLQLPSTSCRIDTCVQRINSALTSCRDFLGCSRCHKDSSAVLLTVSAFQLVLRLFEHLVSQQQQHQPPTDTTNSDRPNASVPPCHIGEYEGAP
ncbi:c6 transcription factor 2 [Diplodia corticola]|uniref:C6 transcription factor 2 n=1 Tax=Diplodia corticola TaxID=236234 RepID=A0A1J9QPQ7_9PEZI|nr:c6 transcription factor 2 [Diplodia corticola]OJD30440.1 c6 transcription factor 2 [Diplodia corticola]